MKLKTSFCNATVLKKDITRFLPVWTVYLICGLLICTTFAGNQVGSVASSIHSVLSSGMPFLIGGYAIVVALLLFGDLSNSRMCNALHAMPLRRGSWFCTHFIAGILMALVPNLILALILMSMLESLWYVALLWLGGSMLMYLFFFGLASLCCLSTGNKFAALLVYALANLFSLELLWMTEELVLPFLYGVRLSTTVFYYFCPVIRLMGAEYFSIDLVYATANGAQLPVTGDYVDGYVVYTSYDYPATYAFCGFESGWIYLFILAAIGIAMTVAALLLYRKRQLEVAGDFAAIAPVRWAISIFGSLACGMIFRLFSVSRNTEYIFLFVGISVGFFLLQMLLQRKVKIFNKTTFIKWGALVLSCVLILILAAVDILGLEVYVPKASRVESVVVADRYLTDRQLERIDNGTYKGDYAAITDPTQIQSILEAHKSAITEPSYNNMTCITIHYRLKNGQTVTRNYNISRTQATYKALSPYFGSCPQFLTLFDSPEEWISHLGRVCIGEKEVSRTHFSQLAKYLWSDASNAILLADQSAETSEYYLLSLSYDDGTRVYFETLEVGWNCDTFFYIQELDEALFSD